MNMVDLAAMVAMLAAHVPFLSDEIEDELNELDFLAADIADYAVRQCSCGFRIEGFDGYHAHLLDVLKRDAVMGLWNLST